MIAEEWTAAVEKGWGEGREEIGAGFSQLPDLFHDDGSLSTSRPRSFVSVEKAQTAYEPTCWFCKLARIRTSAYSPQSQIRELVRI
jgi:hypothetical protein